MGKQLAESKVCTYLQDYQSQFKIYEPYYYRTLTQSKKDIFKKKKGIGKSLFGKSMEN